MISLCTCIHCISPKMTLIFFTVTRKDERVVDLGPKGCLSYIVSTRIDTTRGDEV